MSEIKKRLRDTSVIVKANDGKFWWIDGAYCFEGFYEIAIFPWSAKLKRVRKSDPYKVMTMKFKSYMEMKDMFDYLCGNLDNLREERKGIVYGK